MNRPDLKSLETEMQELIRNADTPPIKHYGFVKDIAPHYIPPPIPARECNDIERIPEVPRQSTTPTVDKMLDRFYSIQQETAKLCLIRAEELEAEAHDLRMRAAILDHQSVQIPEDYRIAVVNEREAALKVQRTMFVNPTEGS